MLLKLLKCHKKAVTCAVALISRSAFCKGVYFVGPGYVRLGRACRPVYEQSFLSAAHSAVCFRLAGWLLGLLFDTEDGSSAFL
jgi:hypothetical protein